MQLWLNFVVMVTLAVMVGVSINANQHALEQARRQAYLELHPELSPERAEAILQGELQVGMDAEQLLISWGRPQAVLVVEGKPQLELWQYPKAVVVLDRQGVHDWAQARSKVDTGADVARRLAYVLSHEELSTRLATLIRQGQIAPGMAPEHVRASWGEPREVVPVYRDALGEFVVWVYERERGRRITVTFQADEVLSWSEFALSPSP